MWSPHYDSTTCVVHSHLQFLALRFNYLRSSFAFASLRNSRKDIGHRPH